MVQKRRHREYIGYRVYSTQRALARSLELSLAPFGLTPGQWNALNQLEEHGAMTQKQLAALVQKEQATIARSIERLVQRGLVKRTPDPRDRRANIIEVTPAASQLLSEIEPAATRRHEQIAQGISEADLSVFFDVLDQVEANALNVIDQRADDAGNPRNTGDSGDSAA